MSRSDLIALLPTGICVLGALLCFLLEAAGTPVGARKQGPRTHVAVIALIAVAAAAVQVAVTWRDMAQHRAGMSSSTVVLDVLVVDELALFGALTSLLIVSLTLLSAVPALRRSEAERGDVFGLLLLHASGQLVLAAASEIITIAAALVFLAICQAALLTIGKQGPSRAEAAAKMLMSAAFQLSLLAFGAALAYGASGGTTLQALAAAAGSGSPTALAALALVVVVIFAMLPVVPLHHTRLDVIHGAPPFAGALWLSSGLVAGSILAVRLISALPGGGAALPSELQWVWIGVAGASVVAPAMAAMDQQRVARMGTYLAIAQGGVACVTLATTSSGGDNGIIALLFVVASGAVASVGALLGLAALNESEGATWEDWSGIGRQHPVFALALVWVLASLAGVPGTIGFAARLWAAEAAFETGLDVLGVVVLVAPALAVAPVLRFTMFLFAKTARTSSQVQMGGFRMAVLSLTAVLVLAGGLFSGSVLDALNSLAKTPVVDAATSTLKEPSGEGASKTKIAR